MGEILLSALLISLLLTIFAQLVEDEKVPANVYLNNVKLTSEIKDRVFKLWLDNRIYVDTAYYSPTTYMSGFSSKPNKDLEFDDGKFRFDNLAMIRRARFGIKDILYNNMKCRTWPRLCLQRN